MSQVKMIVDRVLRTGVCFEDEIIADIKKIGQVSDPGLIHARVHSINSNKQKHGIHSSMRIAPIKMKVKEKKKEIIKRAYVLVSEKYFVDVKVTKEMKKKMKTFEIKGSK